MPVVYVSHVIVLAPSRFLLKQMILKNASGSYLIDHDRYFCWPDIIPTVTPQAFSGIPPLSSSSWPPPPPRSELRPRPVPAGF